MTMIHNVTAIHWLPPNYHSIHNAYTTLQSFFLITTPTIASRQVTNKPLAYLEGRDQCYEGSHRLEDCC